MRGLFLVVTVLFAFASVLGSALSGASAADVDLTSTTGTGVGASQYCELMQADHDKAPIFKPCGKMRNGMAIQCHADPALVPLSLQRDMPAQSSKRIAVTSQVAESDPQSGMFRPPRQIESVTSV